MAGSRNHAALDQRRWRFVRRQVLARDNWECQCGEGDTHYGNEVDHKIPLKDGGAAFDLDNLETLARGCHIEKTRRENTRPDPARDEWRELINQMITEEPNDTSKDSSGASTQNPSQGGQ